MEAQEQNELLQQEAVAHIPPGPAHHPSHNPLGKGRGQPPEDIKAARGAAASVLICLQFMACNALNRESDPYWKLQYLLFCYNYIYNASAM